MGHLIFGVVVNVLGHVSIKERDGGGVGWTSTSSGDFVVLDSPEFVVLLPEIGFDEFGRGQEPQDGHITHCDDVGALRGSGRCCQQRARAQGCSGHTRTFAEGGGLNAVTGWKLSATSTGTRWFA